MARPKKVIDEKLVANLAAINCSYAEIAAAVDCDESTLTRRFAQAIQKGRENGKMSLKRKMWETAMGGNITMMIWLSKQMLGYSEKQEITGKDGQPMAPVVVLPSNGRETETPDS